MILNKSILRFIAFAMIVVFLAGCRASGNRRAPIEVRSKEERQSAVEERAYAVKEPQISNRKLPQDTGSNLYIVQKGDTLYSIAFEHGLDYREVAEQNNIENPAAIRIGQQIKLFSAEEIGNKKQQIEGKPVVISSSVTIRKDQPKIIKLPYSEQAVIQIEKM